MGKKIFNLFFLLSIPTFSQNLSESKDETSLILRFSKMSKNYLYFYNDKITYQLLYRIDRWDHKANKKAKLLIKGKEYKVTYLKKIYEFKSADKNKNFYLIRNIKKNKLGKFISAKSNLPQDFRY